MNRVGDFGFIIALAAIFSVIGSLDYASIFKQVAAFQGVSISILGNSVPILTLITFGLFIGAMGKSAQIPLHVWLPESMEGPTPISALIHAATMVTAGIYMITRLSCLFELVPAVQNIILCLGATGALFLGLVGVVQHDIKRVVAYSTLSQLGYMIAATGASAYAAGMFHLITHAFFKALLFLGAGSVIVGLHHEQDMRKMGGLRQRMPITFWTFLIGTLALTAIPPFAGFYSKDAIIEAVSMSVLPSAGWASFCLVAGAFVTALYSFRALFLTFFGETRYQGGRVHESPASITIPLCLLAIPSILVGYVLAPVILQPHNGLLSSVITLQPSAVQMMQSLSEPYLHGEVLFEAWQHAPFWLTVLGLIVAYYSYIVQPAFPARCVRCLPLVYKALCAKLGFDAFNDHVIVRGLQKLSYVCYQIGDQRLIDQGLIQGLANTVYRISQRVRVLQTGYLYHYAFSMVFGLAFCLVWILYI